MCIFLILSNIIKAKSNYRFAALSSHNYSTDLNGFSYTDSLEPEKDYTVLFNAKKIILGLKGCKNATQSHYSTSTKSRFTFATK